MKAIIKFDAPKSCVVCPLGHGNYVGSGIVCKGVNPSQIYEDAYSNQDKRASFCPLTLERERGDRFIFRNEMPESCCYCKWKYSTDMDHYFCIILGERIPDCINYRWSDCPLQIVKEIL